MKYPSHSLKLPMNILIVDDDPEDTMIFCEAVKAVDPDITCLVKHKCKDIVHTLQNLTVPLQYIFIDAYMNPIDGKECLKEIKKVVDRDKTVIIVYSGYLSDRQISEFKNLGAHDTMIKASNMESLKSHLAKTFNGLCG
jgi:PleD family two-component response regulator